MGLSSSDSNVRDRIFGAKADVFAEPIADLRGIESTERIVERVAHLTQGVSYSRDSEERSCEPREMRLGGEIRVRGAAKPHDELRNHRNLDPATWSAIKYGCGCMRVTHAPESSPTTANTLMSG